MNALRKFYKKDGKQFGAYIEQIIQAIGKQVNGKIEGDYDGSVEILSNR
jgi:hypothetical protein